LIDFEVRPQRPDDAESVRHVITAAFADAGRVADLAESLQARSDLQASLVADEHGRVIGFTHLSISWVDAPDRPVPVLTLSPLAVAPERQSRGVGTRLLAEAITTAEELGAPLVFLEGNPAYYSARGWLPAAELGFMPPSVRIPLPGFRVVPLAGYDRESMHGTLIYNDTFWSHDCVGLRQP
jgi:putative acetyltransferase